MHPAHLILALFIISLNTSPVVAAQWDYIVNSDSNDPDTNPGDKICRTAKQNCTLHAAIEEANADGGSSSIKFASKMDIYQTDLPQITDDGTIIDGSDRWDTKKPGISVSGMTNPIFVIKANHCRVTGIEFYGNTSGIDIYGEFDWIGGYQLEQRNVFLVHKTAIRNRGKHNTIMNNYIGQQYDSVHPNAPDHPTQSPGWTGISTRGFYAQITDNVIVNQNKEELSSAIYIEFGSGVAIEGNYIGTDSEGKATYANNYGIIIEGSGDGLLIKGNIISGCTMHGIWDRFGNMSNATIHNNEIGKISEIKGKPNGGDGIYWRSDRVNNVIKDNTVYGNTGYGISCYYCKETTIISNDISWNGKTGLYVNNGRQIQIGGSEENEGNSINGNKGAGIHLTGDGTSGVTISGNSIGGCYWEEGNHLHGITISTGAHDNTIGVGNCINWNGRTGISIVGALRNVVKGNMIGASKHLEWEAPNGWHGVWISQCTQNHVTDNKIFASKIDGVRIEHGHNNLIFRNHIGTDGTEHHWGNGENGVAIVDGTLNWLWRNEVAYNGSAGVLIDGQKSTQNKLSQNSIYNNSGKGVELQGGANNQISAPNLSSASATEVKGFACSGCRVEIFSDSEDEGRRHEGFISSDPTNGSFTFNGTISGPNVTAIATGTNDFDSSEFSAPRALP